MTGIPAPLCWWSACWSAHLPALHEEREVGLSTMNMTLRGVRFGAYRSIVVNAGSLVGTTAVTSLLGFLYWALAAREYPPSAVGVAAAVVSGTSLLGSAAA